jgi:hypothetical protein
MKTARRCFVVVSVVFAVACAQKTKPEQAAASAPLPAAQPPAAASAPAPAAPKSERGTPAEAQAMLASAAEHYKTVGRTQALADFNTKKAPFGDRDLYVACIGADHKLSANGGFPQYVGASPDLFRDADGKPVADAILHAGNASPSGGSVHYQWINPVTRKNEAKVSFAQKFGEDVCIVGAYNPE